MERSLRHFDQLNLPNPVNKFRDFALELNATEIAKDLEPHQETLDLGSGNGFLAERFSRLSNSNVQLLDIADFNQTDLSHQIYNGLEIPFENSQFDSTVISFVLHHCDDPIAVLTEAVRVTKPGGKLIILEDTPKAWPDHLFNKIHITAFNRQFGLNAKGYFYSTLQWSTIFQRLDLQVQSRHPVSSYIAFPGSHTHFVLQK